MKVGSFLVCEASTSLVPLCSVTVTSMNLGTLRAKERTVTGTMYTNNRLVFVIVKLIARYWWGRQTAMYRSTFSHFGQQEDATALTV